MDMQYPRWAYNTSPQEMLDKMGYSVIFTVDVPRSERIGHYLPRRQLRRKMMQTEGDSEYEFAYLGGEWTHGKHRKLCAIFTNEEFRTFVHDVCIYAQDIETMGSLGAPGFGFGWAPAISFDGESAYGFMNAYVTPIPFMGDETAEAPRNEAESDAAWAVVRKVIIAEYG